MKRQSQYPGINILVRLLFFAPLVLALLACNLSIDLNPNYAATLLPETTAQATDNPWPDAPGTPEAVSTGADTGADNGANTGATLVSSALTLPPGVADGSTPTSTPTKAPTLSPTPCQTRSDWLIYRVVQGDTLASIARRTGSTVAQLVTANCLTNPNSLTVGQVLYVPNIPGPDTKPAGVGISDFHAAPNPADPTGVTTLTWTATGADHVAIQWLVKGQRDAAITRLPIAGSLPVSLPGVEGASFKSFYLCAEDAAGQRLSDPKTGLQVCQNLDVRLINSLRVVTFTVSPNPARSGAVITVSWEVASAARVGLWRLDTPGGRIAEEIGGIQPAKGSLQYTVPAGVSGTLPLVLFAEDANGVQLTTPLSVPLVCSNYPSLAGCPTSQKQIQAAYQPFANGFMVWRGDTHQIYVFYNDAMVGIYQDTWTDGEAVVVAETPPPGTIQPVRGFGKLWASHPEIRGPLGWALAAESGYQTIVETRSFDAWSTTVFTLPNNRIVVVYSGGNWQFAS